MRGNAAAGLPVGLLPRRLSEPALSRSLPAGALCRRRGGRGGSGGGARAGGRRAQRGDCAAVLAGRARRTTHCAPCTHSVRSVRFVQTMRGESEGGSALRAPPVLLRSSPPTRRPRPTPHPLPGGSGHGEVQGEVQGERIGVMPVSESGAGGRQGRVRRLAPRPVRPRPPGQGASSRTLPVFAGPYPVGLEATRSTAPALPFSLLLSFTSPCPAPFACHYDDASNDDLRQPCRP